MTAAPLTVLAQSAEAADDLLRARGRFAIGRGRVPIGRLALLLAVCGFSYGCAMGAFAGRPLQCLFSGLKVPLLLAFSTAVCLPNFFVLNTLLGLRDDFVATLRGVLSAQATVAVVLLALLPVVLFVYASTDSYRAAVLANGVLFALATLGGQRTLDRHYRPLVASNPRHRIGRRAWIGLYVFVAIQLGWVLRPFIGAPGMKVSFLRDEAWSNAYVVVARDLLGMW
ncbi:hypothetical protein [Rohdeia mirabilis]|uniref:hypothetical protein n=1 Tax=Rohdeia mirabilis TaxID=2528008 RepID=UPI003AF40879